MQEEEKENSSSRLLMEALVPVGDYYFVEGKIIIKDDTFDKLVLAVVAHRINNGKTVGRPSEEIEEQIKSRGKNVYVPRKN